MNEWVGRSKKMALMVLVSCSLAVLSLAEYSLEEALKVIRLIDKVQRESLEMTGGNLRSVTLTESELNSYIAYRIESEKEEIMKELQLKLFEENRLECKLVVDLEGQNLPKFLRPRMTFYLRMKLEVGQGSVRFDLEELFLENQRIQPQILDLVIYIGSKIQNTEPFSLRDWYELPYGIKDIETQKGKAIFYY